MLLKEIQYKRNLLDTLEVWDYKMAELSSRIMTTRSEFIKRKKNPLKVDGRQ